MLNRMVYTFQCFSLSGCFDLFCRDELGNVAGSLLASRLTMKMLNDTGLNTGSLGIGVVIIV